MPSFDPTSEQQGILDAAQASSSSLMIRAGAGCAKTTTLELLASALPSDQPTLALAFNVKIKQELEKRFPPHITVLTLNGLGQRALSRSFGRRLEVDEKKLGKCVTEVLRASQREQGEDDWQQLRQLASFAMSQGLVPSTFTQRGLMPDSTDSWAALAQECLGYYAEHLHNLAREVLDACIKQAIQKGIVSFDEQIYLSALFGGAFTKYSIVLGDEAQDWSPLNHVQVKRSLMPEGRLIVVGDPQQSCYAFRGADSQSMESLRTLRTQWLDLQLLTSFRCPKAIVRRQHDHVPGFRAAPGNPEGEIIQFDSGEPWGWPDLHPFAGAGLVVLCRNNAPLLKLALRLLAQGVGVHFLGRDIGKSLVALAKRIVHEDSSVRDCETLIMNWNITERGKGDSQGESADDRAEALLAVLHSKSARARPINGKGLVTLLEEVFAKDRGAVALATGHRAKGLEWDTVVHLDPWRVPSKRALRLGGNALAQERNLAYVIETRARETLILANMEDFQ